MNNIILCWPTAVVLLTFVDYASFCKTKIMINKIIFLAIDILVIFGKQRLGGSGHVIKIELLNSLAKQHT
ncbi:hypothetical protein BANRA_01048 [Acinetobacter baumannii]|nr:hypothetical protein BANRA_01048 [Acinetobacter baumannii]